MTWYKYKGQKGDKTTVTLDINYMAWNDDYEGSCLRLTLQCSSPRQTKQDKNKSTNISQYLETFTQLV